jgi:hypothetical protein
VNKQLQIVFFISLSLFLTVGNIQRASAEDLCVHEGVAFIFFNGVNTTPAGANAAVEEFKRLHGSENSSGEKIKYEYFYNYSNGFEDFVETFEQRLLEQDGLLEGRFELFFQALTGDGPWWSTIINTVSEAAGILEGLVDWFEAAAIQQLTTLLGNPPTQVNYAEHRARLDNRILEGQKLLLVAHSQGNLFVNAAYNYVRGQGVPEESVRVVHIAPASPLLNGNHVLADLDLVINGLRVFGSVASITDFIPGYLLRPPGVNGKRDVLGHGLLEIYINQALAISQPIRNYINDALDTLVAPPVEASTGFFTATLTWNGSGDVDLHTYEPGGLHVFYANPQGSSGYLDTDNTSGFGPEHYYASCDSDILQTGSYQIAVANYYGADGRTATVQISSSAEGVLGTKSATLGGATYDSPSVTLFNVTVAKDPDTGKYSVSLSP